MDEVHQQENVLLVFQKIIEKEDKTSTYKFALLRAVIDLITAQSPHIEERTDHFAIPVFLISDKWIFYYWDLFAENYCQIHSGKPLAFEQELKEIQKSFHSYWEFKQEFQKLNFPENLNKRFKSLANKLKVTILRYPVKLIGSSMGKDLLSLFQIEKGTNIRINNMTGYLDLLQCSPKILLKKSHFNGLKIYGGLLSGRNSIIMNWVDFMQKYSFKEQPILNKKETLSNVRFAVYAKRSPLELLLQSASVERETNSIRNFWVQKIESGQPVFCTWSGEPIKKIEDLAIDHAIPFSVLFNNDYWNLVPVKNNVNSKKSDKILSIQQLGNSKSRLISVWNEYQINEEMAATFVAQCQISLTKETNISFENIFQRFSKINQGLIENRGMEEWTF